MLLNVDRGGKEETQGLGVGREKKKTKRKEKILLPNGKNMCK